MGSQTGAGSYRGDCDEKKRDLFSKSDSSTDRERQTVKISFQALSESNCYYKLTHIASAPHGVLYEE